MWQDIKAIWSRDRGSYPQPSPISFDAFGLWLRVKCTVCMVLGRRGDPWRNFDHVPVWIGPLNAGFTLDGPYGDWTEIGVGLGWRHWRFYEYRNGI